MSLGRGCIKRTVLLGLLMICLSFSVFACGMSSAAEALESTRNASASENRENSAMTIKIGDRILPISWEENESVDALRELCPLTIQMSMYGGFEQVGSLGTSLPRDDAQITTQAGDIVLYSGNQIVIFYGSNSWAYTRLGHVNLSAAEMADLLSHGDVNITLSIE